MPSDNFRYFLAIAKCKNITRAAQQLFISQPSLSKYLKQLEDHLGVRLFFRTSPLSLTPAGEKYYEYAKTVIAAEEKFTNDLFALYPSSLKTVRLGIPIWRYSLLLPKFLPAVFESIPHVNVKVREIFGFEGDYFRLLEQDAIDCCICIPQKVDRRYYHYSLCSEKYLLLGNKSHPLVREALADPHPKYCDGYRQFDIQALNGQTVINYEFGQSMEMQISAELKKAHITPEKVIHTTNVNTAINMAAENLCFAFIPQLGERLAPIPSTVACFTVDTPPFACDFAAIAPIHYAHSKALQDLLKALSFHMKKVCASKTQEPLAGMSSL